MKKQAVNPYLPSWEHVPDGEPHVFGDRLYVFGSHDKSGAKLYCPLDYVSWSCPITDLSNWSCSGTIYSRKQDPHNWLFGYLYAPDVIQGPDGKYYLFYELCAVPYISVAVCDKPDGRYEYLGDVKLPKDKSYDPFDPGVFRDDDGKYYLYFGSCFENHPEKIGAMCVELDTDMLTPKGKPKMIVPSKSRAQGTKFEGHEFFEASSMRKFGETYYFIYSSLNMHELCYAFSGYPDKAFQYGGILLSNADIGLNGRTEENAVNYYANNHGSIENIQGKYYIFGHRHTNNRQYARQGIAQEIQMKDGLFLQAEMTSCGLNGGPLNTAERYPADIACNLIGKRGGHLRSLTSDLKKDEPRIIQVGSEMGYISNFAPGSIAGYKYFRMTGEEKGLKLTVGGKFDGTLSLCFREPSTSPRPLHAIVTDDFRTPVKSFGVWKEITVSFPPMYGIKALYLTCDGKGSLSIRDFVFDR